MNQKITARHYSTKRSNTTLNMFNTFAAKSRVPVNGSARRPEPQEIRDIPIANLLPSKEDTINLEEEAVVIVGRIVKDQVSIFNKCDVQSINHEFMEESEHEVVQLNTPSTHKNKIFLPSASGSSGGFEFDENKTKEMIPLLELLYHYEAQDEGGHAAQIVCFGDGLTAERIVKGHPAVQSHPVLQYIHFNARLRQHIVVVVVNYTVCLSHRVMGTELNTMCYSLFEPNSDFVTNIFL